MPPKKPEPEPEPQKRGPKPIHGETMKVISMRVTPDEHEQYSAAAKASGSSVSEWIRSTLARILRRGKK